jgi:GTP-binding protein
MFVDEVDIIVRAGRGGDGGMAFLRERYNPMGGPSGGNGGHGGSVVFQAHPGLRTLADFRGRRVLVAKNGQPGEGKHRHGKSAKNLLIKVPIGTIFKDRETGIIIGDLTIPGQKITVVNGGKGGRGNATFSTSTNRAPRVFEKGEPGEERNLTLELRLLADVGLVGLPSVGKSTLIGVVSTVRPKVAEYHFTTLQPSVGVVRLGDFASFTMADLPGLIEMAHEGKGLGHQFLRHIRRTSVICHLVEIPVYSDDAEDRYKIMVKAYGIIRAELKAYDEELASKPEIVVWTKSDILPQDELEEYKKKYLSKFIMETGCSEPVIIISSVTGDGTGSLLRELSKRLDIDPLGVESDGDEIPQYLDGEPPEQVSLGELSMETLDGNNVDEK